MGLLFWELTMEIIKDEGLFFNALTRKNHVEKTAAGAGIATGSAVIVDSVKTAVGGAYVTKVVGGLTVPAWLPIVGGKVILGKTVTEFSAAALIAGLNPILLTTIGISGAILLFVALHKRQPLTDKDFTRIGDDMGKIVADLIFLPILIENYNKNIELLIRNIKETMIDDFGYSEEFATIYLSSKQNKTTEELGKEIADLYSKLKTNKHMKQIYKKFDAKKIRKYVLKRVGL